MLFAEATPSVKALVLMAPAGAMAAPLPCFEGSFSSATDLSSAAQCTPTESGFYAPTGGTQQAACSPGTVAPNVRMGVCDKCAAGTYQDEPGKLSCKPCEAGSFCPEAASAALPCHEGSYATATNLTSAAECTQTDPGHFAPTGSTHQTECSPGTVAPNASMGACNKCVAGTYQQEPGQLECKPCEQGSYCPEGSARPIGCPAGRFINVTGAADETACMLAPNGT